MTMENLVTEMDDLRRRTAELESIAREQEKSQLTLRASQAELGAIFAAMTDLIYVFDRSGLCVRAAPTTPPSHKHRPGQWVGKRLEEVLPAKQASAIHTYIGLALDSQQTVKMEYRTDVDGETTWYAASLLPLDGERVIWAARDVTERRQADEALLNYTKRLESLQEVNRAILAARSLQEIAKVALARTRQLVQCDRAATLVYDWNTLHVWFTAIDQQGDLGWPMGARIPLDEYPPPAVLLDPAQRSKAGPLYIADLTAEQNPPPHITRLISHGARSMVSSPLVVEGELIGLMNLVSTLPDAFSVEHIEIAREVSTQLAVTLQAARLREQLKEHADELERRVDQRTLELEMANRELESFSYSVSHDLRTPLAGIESISRLVLEDYGGELPEDAVRLITLIHDNSVAMDRLVRDLLTFSRTQRQPLHKEHVEVHTMVQQVVDELAGTQGERPVQVVLGTLPPCEADPVLLKQVWMNLVSNAFKFTRKSPAARVEIGSTGTRGEPVVYFVRDNGVGFDMDQAEKLFGVFQRLHPEDEYEGSGVGLAIVQRIVRRHGGRIWTTAAVDQGATFYFTLGSGSSSNVENV